MSEQIDDNYVNGVDPVTVAAHIITGLQEIHARELGLSDEAILTIGTVNAGNAANVIPDTAHMSGTIRTYDESTRAFIKQRVSEIASGIATAFRATATVTYGSGCPCLYSIQSAENQLACRCFVSLFWSPTELCRAVLVQQFYPLYDSANSNYPQLK